MEPQKLSMVVMLARSASRSSSCQRSLFSGGQLPIRSRIPLRTLSFISWAALRVKVMARIREALVSEDSRIWRKRSTRTRVLPEPAPADTETFRSSVRMASSCSFVKSAMSLLLFQGPPRIVPVAADVASRTVGRAGGNRVSRERAAADSLRRLGDHGIQLLHHLLF